MIRDWVVTAGFRAVFENDYLESSPAMRNDL